MYKVGVFPGRFIPPHRGHLNSIIHCATKCEKLYVVLSDNKKQSETECKEAGVKNIPVLERFKWLSIELQGFDHIKVIYLDETSIPSFPYGWEAWSKTLKELIPESISVIFGGEVSYKDGYQKWYPETVYELFNPERDRFPISGTEIRKNPIKHWDYILGAARPFFAKKVLIAGTESCGKTTITKYLAKIYHTSWSEEVGRYYSAKFLGGNEDVFSVEDFERIVLQQDEQDKHAIRTANKITFFDSDAVITQYYLNLYLGKKSDLIDLYIKKFVEREKYDYIFYYEPDVKWVDDGLRFVSDQKEREEKSKLLLDMYKYYGLGDKIIIINGDYSQRLENTIKIIDDILKE